MTNFSRRQFLAAMAVIGTGTFLTACTSRESTAGDGAASGDEVENVNVLRVGALGKAASAQRDPYQLLPNDSDMLISSLIWEALTVPGEKETVVPRLMQEWKQNNLTEWEFMIADGATFHDGSSVTSEDVVWSLKKMLSDEENSFRLPVMPDSIRAAGANVVVMETAEPNSQLPMLARLMTFVMKKGSSAEKPIGSGPFQLVSWENGSAKLKRFDNYHGTVAGVAEVHVIPFEDSTAMTNALLSGQIDLAQAAGPIAARSVEGNEDIKIVRRMNDSVIPLIMRTSDGPFSDVRVRQALRLAVDREQIIQRALSGYGTPANDILGTADSNLDSSLVRKRDVVKAKNLLQEADFDLEKTYDLYVTPEAPGQVEAMKVIADQVKEIGMTLNVVEQDSGTFYDETWTKADLYCGYWGTNDSVLFFAGKVLDGDAASNETAFDDAEFNEIYDQVLESTDTERINQLSRQLQKIEFERSGYLVWGASDGVDLARANLSGLPKAPGYGRVLLETVKKA